MEEKVSLFEEFQHISNKLKKRRILKKPNVTEASQQFENLAGACEAEDLRQYAGLCYQAAANCQSSLGNTSEQGYLLLKACRQFIADYSRYVSQKMVYTDEIFHEAIVCYKDCLESFANNEDPNIPNVNIISAAISMEMADALRFKLGRLEESINEYKRTLKFLNKSPIEKINCLHKLISAEIELGDYDDALRYTNDLVEEAQKIQSPGHKEDVLCSSEITRILLLLILQPTPQQISPLAASIMEKYAWVEMVDNNEIADLQTTLSKNGVSVTNEKLFLCLQSLVMACQYGDTDCLGFIEVELIPFLSFEQKNLLRKLVKQKLQK